MGTTAECSRSGVGRAHVEGRDGKFHLIVGCEMQLHLPVSLEPSLEQKTGTKKPKAFDKPGEKHARLVLLAQTRRGYGNLSHWITVARRRAAKGSYLAHPGDVEGKVPNAPVLAGLPECLALLVPDATQTFEEVFAHAMWLKTWFQDRAAIAIELLNRPGDPHLSRVVQRVAGFTGLAIVATGDVLMHARSRKPLQDTLYATRLKRPVAERGAQLAMNAEQYLRSRSRLRRPYPPARVANPVA